jgi:hypothetical protein
MAMRMAVRVVVLMMLMVIVIVMAATVVMIVYGEFNRRNAGAEYAIDVDVDAAEREAPQRALQLFDRQTGIDQRAERHVA